MRKKYAAKAHTGMIISYQDNAISTSKNMRSAVGAMQRSHITHTPRERSNTLRLILVRFLLSC